MDVVHERSAGIDISKRDAKVAVRVPGKRSGSYSTTVKTFGSTTAQVVALVDYLLDQRVTTVVMEATSDYWKPFYYVMEDKLPVMLVNAKHVRNIPGRKSDVSDAAWLAQLGAHGLLRASFIPAEPVRHLRDLTRARSMAARDRVRIVQRLEKFLESSGIKLSAVATDLTGVSARAMLEALVAGERDPKVLADLAKRTLRHKIPALVEALQGRFTEHHAFMVSQYLAQLDTQQATIEALTARIETVIAPFAQARDLLVTIPGISQMVADVIIAETGADMAVFPTPGHLASWAGVCPGMNESAGRVKSTKTRPGNKYLKGALGMAAFTAARLNNTYFSAKYRRILVRRGPMKALVAVEHAMLTAAWHMLTTGELYKEPGADYFSRHTPGRAKTRALKQLESLGYHVTLQPLHQTG